MNTKEQIIHNLSETDLFSRSKIAEILGISVNEVYQTLKEKGKESSFQICEHEFCPTPLLCEKEGCQPNG